MPFAATLSRPIAATSAAVAGYTAGYTQLSVLLNSIGKTIRIRAIILSIWAFSQGERVCSPTGSTPQRLAVAIAPLLRPETIMGHGLRQKWLAPKMGGQQRTTDSHKKLAPALFARARPAGRARPDNAGLPSEACGLRQRSARARPAGRPDPAGPEF